jgi:large subunit ribosomal protein L21
VLQWFAYDNFLTNALDWSTFIFCLFGGLSMYAVVKSGGKQYKVTTGDVLRVEKLDVPVGDKITLDDVLLLSDGKNVQVEPSDLAEAKVTARVTAHGRRRKIVVFKYKRRKRYRRKQGHRQWFTELAIENIEA